MLMRPQGAGELTLGHETDPSRPHGCGNENKLVPPDMVAYQDERPGRFKTSPPVTCLRRGIGVMGEIVRASRG